MFNKLSNIFNRGSKQVESTTNEPVATETVAEQIAPREYKPTKKKKNTYVVTLNTMTMPGAFSLCDSAPLVVVKVNGVEKERGLFMECTRFPNPGASTIEELFQTVPEWRIIVGDKTAQTIIEYLDKESGKPALILYSNGSVKSLIPGMDENTVVGTRLNHASRRDFIHKYGRIIELVKIVNPLIDVRRQAMRHAPQRSDDKYAEFIAELNRQQIERAKQIVASRQK